MISNSTITDTIFNYNITLLNILDATIDRCLFKGLIDKASISGDLTRCQFEGLSNNISIEGPLYDMTIQLDITPSSANYVLDENAITKFIPITSLIINNQVIPRLKNHLHKECFIDIKEDKNIFIVLLATDDNSPRGIIVMWSGDANNIPPGYAICNGDIVDGIQTPDLSGRFIKMIDSNGSVGPVDNSDLESDGKSIKIKANNLPNHTHNTLVTIEQYTGSNVYYYVARTVETSVNKGEGDLVTTGDIVTTSNDDINLTHTHNATATNENMDNYANDPINILPNYYALIFIMKL